MNATTEPHTAAQKRDQQVGHAEPLAEPIEPTDRDHGGANEPPSPPPPIDYHRDEGGRPERPPAWWELMVWGALFLFLGALLSFIATVIRPEGES